MNLKEAAQLVAIAVAALPQHQDREMTATARAWAVILADLDFDLAQKALVATLRKSPFWPSPSDILEQARNMKPPAQGIPTAEEAWIEVQAKLDPYKAPKWSNPIVAEAVRVLGHRNLCFSDNPAADRAHFMKVYANLTERQRIEEERPVVLQIVAGKMKLIGGTTQ